jgi:hypothetical protein
LALTLRELVPISIQTTVFTPGLSFAQGKILSFVLSELADKLDGTPISLPRADRLPPAVPRIVVQSSDKRYKLEAAPARFNLYQLKIDAQSLPLSQFAAFAADASVKYIQHIGARVGRLASVLTRAAKIPDPAKEISERFCKPEFAGSVFSGSETVEIHNHRRYRLLDRFHVNGWVRWKCGYEGPPEKRQRLLIVQQDINTLSEDLDSLEFGSEDIKEYFESMEGEFDATLSAYMDP